MRVFQTKSTGEAASLYFKEIQPAILDRAERIIFLVLYVFFAIRMTRAYLVDGQVTQLLFLFDQFIVLAFFICRRPTDRITTRPADWLAGLLGSTLTLLLGPVTPEAALAPQSVSGFFVIFGLVVHLLAKLTLRRSFGAVAANRGVKASGLYRYVRHPMYLGYILSEAGFLLAGPNLRNVTLILLVWLFFLWRIEAEEKLLAEDAAYRDFMAKTPFRLLPGVF